MALRHKWLDKAKTELDETIEYVFREFGERVAESVYVEVKACVFRLTEFPNLGLRYKISPIRETKSGFFICESFR